MPAQGEPVCRATVEGIIALVKPWSGVQVRRDKGDSDPNDHSASGEDTGHPDKLHIRVRLTALIADGASVTSDRDDFGISMPRHVLSRTYRVGTGIEDAINQMLGRDPKQHRPPRLAWYGLIDALAGSGIVVTEQELINAPLTIDLSPEANAQIARTSR